MGPDSRRRRLGKGVTVGLHNRELVQDRLDECVFASAALATELPKYRFPEAETLPHLAYQVIHDELLLDGNAVKTWPRFVRRGRSPRFTP